MKNEKFCSQIAFLGVPNAGKSTLLNACVGQKIVGVSRKPQTTRNAIRGVLTQVDHQLIFLDTPGIHKSTSVLNHMMNKEIWDNIDESVNIFCYLIDVTRGLTEKDKVALKNIWENINSERYEVKPHLAILATKKDRLKKREGVDALKKIKADAAILLSGDDTQQWPRFKTDNIHAFLISSKEKEDIATLIEFFHRTSPVAEWQFEADELTDKSQNFVVSELIREQVFRAMSEEIPYQTAVLVESITEPTTAVEKLQVNACIVVGRPQHKGMLIGKQAKNLKEMGTLARKSLETFFGQKVFLKIHVKVVEDWFSKEHLISELQGLIK